MNNSNLNSDVWDISISTSTSTSTSTTETKPYKLAYEGQDDETLKTCLSKCSFKSPFEPIDVRIIIYDKQCRKMNVSVDREGHKPLILISEDGLMGQSYFNNGNECHTKIRPIIHICEYDLLDKKESYQLRYRNILDNSIWNYFCQMNDTERLEEILCDIRENYKLGLYKLSVAHEYADFNYRLTRENFFDASAHGSFVVPFPFHSEKAMRDNIATKESKEKKQKILKYKWRILLIDDKIGKDIDGKELPDGTLTNYDDTQSDQTKHEIVLKRIQELFEYKADIHITAVHNIEGAKKQLKTNIYDIVLLDYLLGKHENQIGKREEREYSYNLLKDINEDKRNEQDALKGEKKYENIIQYGPHKILYFMFISAFETAVNERLRAEGLQKNEPYWYIADGACPINTPYLFKNNLLHLMHMRLHDSGIEGLCIEEIINSLNIIFSSAPNVRQNASENFEKILTLLYHYKSLLQDVVEPNTDDIKGMKGSALVTSFIQKHPHLGALLEHISQLVYLTAFGTIRQWPEMWNEYHFIRSILYMEIEDIANNSKEQVDEIIKRQNEMKDVIQKIEKHILNLKKGNFNE